MSMMQKLLEINDEAVALRTECEKLRSDQKTLQEICAIRVQRIVELEADLRKALGERDELRSENKKLQDICADGGRRITELQAELDAARRDLQALYTTTLPPKSAGSGLLRDVSHYTEAAEVDRPVADDAPAEPENCGFEGKILQEVSQPVQVQEVTLSAYVVGDTVSPKALRIVWATEEWIEQSKFGIVHAMKDVMFLDQDRFTPEQFSLTLMLNKQ